MEYKGIFIMLIVMAMIIGLLLSFIFINNVNFRGTSERPFNSIKNWEYAMVSGWTIGNGEVLEEGIIVYYVNVD